MKNSTSMSRRRKRGLWRHIMINCSLSNTRGEGMSSSRVQNMFCGKVFSEREGLAPDKGTERSSL